MATKRCSRQRAIPAFRVGIIVWRQKETRLVLLEHFVAPPLHGLAERPYIAQRPGPWDAWLATKARWPGSLQRMIRRRGSTRYTRGSRADRQVGLGSKPRALDSEGRVS
jgi:hypothetical protein